MYKNINVLSLLLALTIYFQGIAQETIKEQGYFKYDYIQKLLDKAAKEIRYYPYQSLWNLMAVEIWHKIYIDSDNLKKPNLNINRFMK